MSFIKKQDLRRIEEINSLLKIAMSSFTVGRIVVQMKPAAGRHTKRIGWVTSEWPQTMVLFEDGSHVDVHMDLAEVLQPIDEWVDDIEAVKACIENMVKTRNINRKATYM